MIIIIIIHVVVVVVTLLTLWRCRCWIHVGITISIVRHFRIIMMIQRDRFVLGHVERKWLLPSMREYECVIHTISRIAIYYISCSE